MAESLLILIGWSSKVSWKQGHLSSDLNNVQKCTVYLLRKLQGECGAKALRRRALSGAKMAGNSSSKEMEGRS